MSVPQSLNFVFQVHSAGRDQAEVQGDRHPEGHAGHVLHPGVRPELSPQRRHRVQERHGGP